MEAHDRIFTPGGEPPVPPCYLFVQSGPGPEGGKPNQPVSFFLMHYYGWEDNRAAANSGPMCRRGAGRGGLYPYPSAY